MLCSLPLACGALCGKCNRRANLRITRFLFKSRGRPMIREGLIEGANLLRSTCPSVARDHPSWRVRLFNQRWLFYAPIIHFLFLETRTSCFGFFRWRGVTAHNWTESCSDESSLCILFCVAFLFHLHSAASCLPFS